MASNRWNSSVTLKQSPNSRTHETKDPSRTSLNSNPFAKPSIVSNRRNFNPATPANSPSDFGRRKSIDKSMTSLCGYEEKENPNPNPKNARTKSPSISKGTKNFMSPTISAASKITTSSPRKKVLTERNEPARSSVSSSDGSSSITYANLPHMAEYADRNLDRCVHEKKIDLKSGAASNWKDSELESESGITFEQRAFSGDLIFSGDSIFKISPAPVEADPSLPPYDPKTNYLSPRPQFLHYKPNPRLEYYRNLKSEIESGDGKCLEESFSDAESSQELQFEEESERESDSEDASCAGEFKEVEEEPSASSPIPKSVEGERKSKPCFMRLSSVSWLLVLVIACYLLPVSDTPTLQPLMISHPLFLYSPFHMPESAKFSVMLLAKNFRLWSAQSASYISRLILFPSRGDDRLDLVHYRNLTSSLEDQMTDMSFQVNEIVGICKQNELGTEEEEGIGSDFLNKGGESETIGAEPSEIENVLEPNNEREADDSKEIEAVEQKILESEIGHHPDEPVAEDLGELEAVEKKILESEIHHPNEPEDVGESEDVEPKIPEPEILHHQGEPIAEDLGEFEAVEEKILEFGNRQDEPVVEDLGEFEDVEPKILEPEILHHQDEPEDEDLGEFEVVEMKIHESAIRHHQDEPVDDALGEFEDVEQKFPESESRNQAAIEEFEELLRKAPGSIYTKPELHESGNLDSGAVMEPTTITEANHEDAEQDFLNKNSANWEANSFVYSLLMLSSIAYLIYKKRKPIKKTTRVPAIPNPLPRKEFEASQKPKSMESCPSGMSSFQRCSFGHQSHEKKPRKYHRRESFASSSDYSMGSPSYGSFTTYEIINSKSVRAQGDEETATPVRRSSRIRSKVTSP